VQPEIASAASPSFVQHVWLIEVATFFGTALWVSPWTTRVAAHSLMAPGSTKLTPQNSRTLARNRLLHVYVTPEPCPNDFGVILQESKPSTSRFDSASPAG
jgi:hypothetical protein